jgi:hypothetical protein
MLKAEFFRALRKLALLPYGLVMTSHVDIVEVKTRSSVISKAIPTIPKSGRDIIVGWVDIILYAESVVGEDGVESRIVHTQPSENWLAGDRTEHAFGRKLPEVIELDFKTFEKAFYDKGDK